MKRAVLALAVFGAVYAGLHLVAGVGWALVGVGILAWLDLQLPERR